MGIEKKGATRFNDLPERRIYCLVNYFVGSTTLSLCFHLLRSSSCDYFVSSSSSLAASSKYHQFGLRSMEEISHHLFCFFAWTAEDHLFEISYSLHYKLVLEGESLLVGGTCQSWELKWKTSPLLINS